VSMWRVGISTRRGNVVYWPRFGRKVRENRDAALLYSLSYKSFPVPAASHQVWLAALSLLRRSTGARQTIGLAVFYVRDSAKMAHAAVASSESSRYFVRLVVLLREV
jgi:hypothetical protein